MLLHHNFNVEDELKWQVETGLGVYTKYQNIEIYILNM